MSSNQARYIEAKVKGGHLQMSFAVFVRLGTIHVKQSSPLHCIEAKVKGGHLPMSFSGSWLSFNK